MPPWRTTFFAVNFGAAVLMVVLSGISIVEAIGGSGPPFAFLGAVCLIGPAVVFGTFEWFLYARKVRSLERPLGVVCGLIGGLAVFAFVSNAAEAVAKGDLAGMRFWLGFGATCFAIAACALWCCWLRVRRRTFPEPRGFPVGPPAEPTSPSSRSG